MILMYHKVYPESPSIWWVTVDDFYRQMAELQGYEVVRLSDYNPENPKHAVITFDGIYQNVLHFAAPILKHFNYPFELFIIGDHLGKGNEFDTSEPYARFASKQELKELVKLGGRLQWHTHSHPKLETVESTNQIKKELSIPQEIRSLDPDGFSWFAYPHGEFNQEYVDLAKEQYAGAVSCDQGNDTHQYKLNRLTVTNETRLGKHTISVIIPCYNYGAFLIEAVESVLRQTRLPDEILISDDASTDNTYEIAQSYTKRYPNLIKLNRNPKNLGIVEHFNVAVEKTTGDYLCLLGADNRFRSDYLEKTAAVLDQNPKLAVAYTDFALFGPRAAEAYDRFPPKRQGEIIDSKLYCVTFPNFSSKTKKSLGEANFIHGSSLYRRQAFKEVGGYQKQDKAEDHHLFYTMIQKEWGAKRVPEPLLEYRQHSLEQTNTKLITQAEIEFYKAENRRLKQEIIDIKNSTTWRMLFLYKEPKKALKQFLPKLPRKLMQLLKRHFS